MYNIIKYLILHKKINKNKLKKYTNTCSAAQYKHTNLYIQVYCVYNIFFIYYKKKEKKLSNDGPGDGPVHTIFFLNFSNVYIYIFI